MTGSPVSTLSAPSIGQEERAAVDAVLRSGQLTQGPEVAAFESELAATVAGRPCVAVSSGTSALHLGLLALGVGPGDEVIVPSFSFAATANAVALTGAHPVFADIEPVHMCLDTAAVGAAITPQTVGIVPVHLFGQPADVAGLRALAQRHGLALVEDAAQAQLASYGGQTVGTFGDVAAFSFHATKNMTTGEGGLAVCADEAIARRVRLLRNQGMEERSKNEIVGFNARMTDIQAALGRAQLRKLPDWIRRRQANARYLTHRLREMVATPTLTVPEVAPSALAVWHQYTIRVEARDHVVEHLTAAGIGWGIYYSVPIHRLPAYDRAVHLPETEAAAAEVVSLPVHPGLTEDDLDRVASAVIAAVTT